jgi:FKBP-type peptidyl-prolyl cis-trans isomerase FkpA
MKNSVKILFALLITVGLSSCLKDNSFEPYDGPAMLKKEAPILKEYIETTPGLEGAIWDSTGVWYKIIEEGISSDELGFYEYKLNSSKQIEAPQITVIYEGKLVSNGTVFDKSDKVEGVEFLLGTLIDGWKIGFYPKAIEHEGKTYKVGGLTELGLQQGAKIRLIIPSPYAYGPNNPGKVPANSPLDFTIEVLKVAATTSTQ